MNKLVEVINLLNSLKYSIINNNLNYILICSIKR